MQAASLKGPGIMNLQYPLRTPVGYPSWVPFVLNNKISKIQTESVPSLEADEKNIELLLASMWSHCSPLPQILEIVFLLFRRLPKSHQPLLLPQPRQSQVLHHCSQRALWLMGKHGMSLGRTMVAVQRRRLTGCARNQTRCHLAHQCPWK